MLGSATTSDRLTAVTRDGVALALRRHPAIGARRGVVLCVHAMMTSSGYLAPFAGGLARSGLDVFRLDLRGHGRSVPPSARSGKWGFDDYVVHDLPAAIETVAAAAGVAASEIGFLGHSLGGLVGVAAFGTGAAPAPRRLTLVAASPWIRSGPGRLARLAVSAALAGVSAPFGYLPARRLRLGSDDEPASYMLDFLRWVTAGAWSSREGVDYLAAAGNIRSPALVVVGAADRRCQPEDARTIAGRLGGPRAWRPVGRAHGDATDADHMGFFRRGLASTLWRDLAAFMGS